MASEVKKRKFHTAEFKAKVGLEALAGEKTLNEIAQRHKVHPVQIRQWKAEIQAQAKTLFEGKRGPKVAAVPEHGAPELLYSEIGGSKLSWTGSKKSQG